MITPEQLTDLGFIKDEFSVDRFELYISGIHIELSGSGSIGNHKPIKEGEYMLTTDLGFRHLSKPFDDIEQIKQLVKILT